MGRTLATLVKLERSHGFFFNWYDPRDGATLKVWPGGGPVRPFLSTVDNGWLAVALMMVRNARPALREVADSLLDTDELRLLLRSLRPEEPGRASRLAPGGFYADDNTYAGYHYGMLNTEARIASYVAIARNQVPPSTTTGCRDRGPPASRWPVDDLPRPGPHYLGVAVDEGYNTYRGLRIVPSWDGSMFEAMMVPCSSPKPSGDRTAGGSTTSCTSGRRSKMLSKIRISPPGGRRRRASRRAAIGSTESPR